MMKIKKAIIIGASSGIGYELAKLLVNKNYIVGITGRRKIELEHLKQSNPEKFAVSSFDCTTENNSEKLNELTKGIGGLDLLIFCSGIGDLNESLVFEIENSTNKLNVMAFTEVADWSYNYFQNHGKGHFVAISSIAGIRGNRTAPAYSASKAYQINYLEGLRVKAKKTKKPIYVTDIRPGFIDTKMAKGDALFWVATKEKAAKQIFEIIKQKKDVGYVTRRWWVISKLLKVIPNVIYNKM